MAPTYPAILLLCEDPVARQVIRSLLRAVSRSPPDVHAPETVEDALALAPECRLCLIEPGFAGVATDTLVQRLGATSPALELHAVLGALSRRGDRAELVRALRLGVRQTLLLEELSVAALSALLARAPGADGFPQSTLRTTHTPAAIGLPSRPQATTGSWHISLQSRRARFDDATLARLGQHGLGSSIGDWKGLIHPDDVDSLVNAVQATLEGSGMPADVRYRLRHTDGSWIAVQSGAVSVTHGADGTPDSIRGSFSFGNAPDSASVAAATLRSALLDEAPQNPPPDLARDCQTELMCLARTADGNFVVRWCNTAAASSGTSAMRALPACDGVVLTDSLVRVADTGIPESHDAMLLDRREPPAWRRFQLGRLADGAVLVESIDISDLMNMQSRQQDAEELAGQVAHSLPLTVLVLDETGTVLHCLSAAGGVPVADPQALIGSTVDSLLGTDSGRRCHDQVIRTLNTGQPGVSVLETGTADERIWMECHTTLLRANPGTPPRVVLGLLDATRRATRIFRLRADLDLLRATLHSVPLPLYLKDAEGRYIAVSPAFARLMGIEESMLAGKTDFEVFPDETAAEMHSGEQRALRDGQRCESLRDAGTSAQRAGHWCLEFPVLSASDTPLGCAGLWMPLSALPRATHAWNTDAPEPYGSDIQQAAARVVNQVEDALTDTGDYVGVLRQLEQLVETTMQAQALIHNAAGQPVPPPPRPLVALGPLAQEIFDLERILVPPTARFENHIDDGLPPAHCEPVAFHQILLRAIRHARRTLCESGTLCIRLRASTGGGRSCLSCGSALDAQYVELVIEDSDSRVGEQDFDFLARAVGATRSLGTALDDLAEIHSLAHAQGGHLQIQRNLPAGTSVHVFFRAGSPAELGDTSGRSASIIAQFPRGRGNQRS